MISAIAPAAAAPIPTNCQSPSVMARKLPGSDALRKLPRSPMRLKVLCALSLVVACAGSKPPLTAAKDAVIDCGKVQRGPLLGAVVEIGLMFYRAVTSGSTASIDGDRIADLAVERGADVGGCALAEFVKGLNEPAKDGVAVSALMAAPDPAAAALERARARLGGVRWKLADGTVR